MLKLFHLEEDNYFLPEDGELARAEFLRLVSMPTETWISGYGFTMRSVFDQLKANDAQNVPFHLLLDYTQSQGIYAKNNLKNLNRGKIVSDITLTTAGKASKRPSQLWHWKGMVKRADDGGDPYCWDGSVNFSASGWHQGNSARVFRSQAWADRFLQQFESTKAWALEQRKHYQATILQEGLDDIDAYFAEIENESDWGLEDS